jgi:hypothetical protein
VLRLGAALDGVLPDPAHLPALTGAVDASGAAAELVGAGLVVVESGRHRLAGGVADEAAGLMRGPSSWAVAAMQHFTWWVSHPTVTAAQVAEEADVILACMREVERLGKPASVRVLARAAAPAFASALRFEAWRDGLELGGAASGASGAASEQAWFRHELAVLALCTGASEAAREEAVAASRLRDAADKRGIAADRRILVLAGERPGSFGASQDGLGVRVGKRVSVSGKRGVMTLGAAGVLVVTLAVVIGFGSDSPGGDGGGSAPSGVTSTDVAPAAVQQMPAPADVSNAPEASGNGSPSASGRGTGTPSPIRSTPGTKAPSTTAQPRGATPVPPPNQGGQQPTGPQPGGGPNPGGGPTGGTQTHTPSSPPPSPSVSEKPPSSGTPSSTGG